jgi:hypothetical protein
MMKIPLVIIVYINMACFLKVATMPATTTTKAPVGPPIWKRDPPSAEMRKPVMTAQ